ncbi:MAG: M48 family metalloprotease [Treponema sp.]|nr:M48 family metalloprotease [Treponema sp.]
MGKSIVIIILLITASSLTAQVNNISDALARMESAIDNSQEEFSKRDSYYLGRTVAAHILYHFRLCMEKPALTNYLNLICKTLAINSAAPDWYNGYYVMVLDTPAPNAFSTPGGHIFITRGLLDLASSEDMLATIIAHELAHIQLQHGTAEIMNTRTVQRLGQEQQRILQNLSIETQQQLFSELVNEIVDSLFSRGYSQLQEFEADSLALNILASAGYNPGSLIETLRIFESIQGNQTSSLNATHPLPSQRIANIERQMQAYRSFSNTSITRRNRFNNILERSSN